MLWSHEEYLAGAGVYDITGPAAELGMMGYGQISQKTSGILQRLYARAFIVANQANSKRIVLVVADLGQIFQSIHQGVLQKLKLLFGDIYNETNIMLSATHTHSGPGGYAHDTFYNLTILGFDNQNFEVITNGIVQAIVKAHQNLAPGRISIAKGEVIDASFNRSEAAYQVNPISERLNYSENVHRTMTQLRMDNVNGPFALLNWFAVHGTSLNNKNLLISGDNKGFAAANLETLQNQRYNIDNFIAGFAQEASGDISPNAAGQGKDGNEGIKKLISDANKQVETASSLFDNFSTELIQGFIDTRQIFVNMADVSIAPEFTEGDGPRKTCPSAIGISMLAGTKDGPGFGRQGLTCGELSGIFSGIICDPFFNQCHGVKPIILSTGTTNPPMIPQILPFQLMKLGQLMIIGLPFEITTMAGRRIRERILTKLSSLGISHVVIASLSNGYASYITTKEEYQVQAYEGGSNQFGPYSLNAIFQILDNLASLMLTNQQAAKGPEPLDLSGKQITLQTPVIFDSMPLIETIRGKNFGSIKTDARARYAPLDTVIVEFFGAHPKNNLLTGDSFLFVEQYRDGLWYPIFSDKNIETSFFWNRLGIASSVITVIWRIPVESKGMFRIRHKGFSKNLWQTITPYEGFSSPFLVESN